MRCEIVRLIGTAEKAEQPVQLEHGLAAGVLDRAQHLHRLLRTPQHDPPCRAGLNAHDADVVRDDVVQFPSDAYTLFEHCASCVLVPLALQLSSLRGELLLARSESSDGQPEQQR